MKKWIIFLLVALGAGIIAIWLRTGYDHPPTKNRRLVQDTMYDVYFFGLVDALEATTATIRLRVNSLQYGKTTTQVKTGELFDKNYTIITFPKRLGPTAKVSVEISTEKDTLTTTTLARVVSENVLLVGPIEYNFQ
jgi:hypothetical protein